MRRCSFIYKVYDLYADGFRNMDLGRTLWLVILIKLFVVFFLVGFLLMPDHISENAPGGSEADFVAGEMLYGQYEPI